MQTQTAAHPAGLSTDDLARAIAGRPSSIRVRLCQTGSYYGIKPFKLPSGRLLWPADAVEQLLNRAAARHAEA